MKPPSKPFFVEVRRSRSIPAQAQPSPPPRPTSSWEDTPEPAGARSKAWQHAEQFFQPRASDPAPEAERPVSAPVEPAPVPALVPVERQDEVVQTQARDGKGDKAAVKRGQKVVKAPMPQPEEAKAVPAKKPRRAKAPQEERLSIDTRAAPDAKAPNGLEPSPSANQPEETKGRLRKAPPASNSLPDETSAEDATEEGGRRPLSARAARSAAKPAERWTCRLRHVRRNLGSGRIGQLRS